MTFRGVGYVAPMRSAFVTGSATGIGEALVVRLQREGWCVFGGINVPGTAAQHALTIGSPLSAPPLMLIALIAASRRGRTDAVRLLAGMLIFGILGEVDTWTTLRRPGLDPVGTACVALDVVLPVALLVETR